MRRRGDVKRERGFQIRLLKIRVDPTSVGGLKRRIHVNFSVRRVDGAVHCGAIVRVEAIGCDSQLVEL